MPPLRSDLPVQKRAPLPPAPAVTRRSTRPRLFLQEAQRLALWLPQAGATRRLGQLLSADAEGGDILALSGALGAGKTCLVGGLARGLGIRQPVASPSFSLVNQHVGRLTLYHVDLYRLGHESELAELGLWEAAESGGLLAIEWLERFPDAVSPDRLQIHLAYRGSQPGPTADAATAQGLPDGGRIAEIRASGPRSTARLRALLTRLAN